MLWDWDYALEIVPILGKAAIITVEATFLGFLIAASLGLVFAILRMLGPTIAAPVTILVELVRSTPLLIQIFFLYFVLPKFGVTLDAFTAGVLALGLHYATYCSEVYRAGLENIPRGQWEASYLLGMNPLLAFRRIILPQAFRIALPAMTNDFVSLFKDTSVAYAISVWELATAYRELANASGQFLLLGTAVSIFYLAMSLPMAHLARRLERRLQRRQAVDENEPELSP